MNLYRETDPWDTDYYASLPILILAEEDKAYFYFFGVLYQLWRLSLYPERPIFFDCWTPLWWRLFESKYRPNEELERILINKTKVDEQMYLIYHSPRFFQIYEQAKSKLRLGVQYDESPGDAS